VDLPKAYRAPPQLRSSASVYPPNSCDRRLDRDLVEEPLLVRLLQQRLYLFRLRLFEWAGQPFLIHGVPYAEELVLTQLDLETFFLEVVRGYCLSQVGQTHLVLAFHV
jgi:hypothetical protein